MLKELILLALVSVTLAAIDTTSVNEDFGADCLFAHNLYRKLHGVPALKLSPKLSQLAINRAKELAELEELNVKQNKFHGQTLGETVGSVGGFSSYNGKKSPKPRSVCPVFRPNPIYLSLAKKILLVYV